MTSIFLYILLKLNKGGTIMIDVYVSLIIKKRRTIEQVPVQLQAEVLADLNSLGLDGYGDPLPV